MADQEAPVRQRLLVHLGWDATTGSELQQRCHASSASLRDMGVLYPASGRSASFPHRHDLLAKTFATGAKEFSRDDNGVLASLRTEIARHGATTVLLSSPVFASLGDEDIRRLAGAFADFELRPVAVVCNFTDWLSAVHGERVLTEPGTPPPAAAQFAPRIFGRLAVWGQLAHDGFLDVVDADNLGPAMALRDLEDVLGLGGTLSVPTRATTLHAGPCSPAVVAIVRELRARGVPELELRQLVAQLASVPFTEDLTNVTDPDAAALDARYADFHLRLREAPFARWHNGTTGVTPPRRRIHVNGAAAGVFAIGRALDA